MLVQCEKRPSFFSFFSSDDGNWDLPSCQFTLQPALTTLLLIKVLNQL